jgi:hypothetical protein
MRKSLAIGAMVLALAQAGGASASVGPKVSPGSVHAWSVEYMNGAQSISLSEAVATARAFDVIVALPKAYAPYVAQMKAANPNLQLFTYAKGMFTYDTSLPDAAYSHDKSGRRIHGLQYSTWLLNPNSSQAVNAQAKAAQRLLARSGYDGVFLDTLGPAALNPSFVSGLPVNPATGQVWTVSDWMTASASFAGRIAAAIGKPTIGNGLRDGPNYFDAGTKQLLNGLDGGMAEGWLRGATNPLTSYPSETAWKQNVDALVDAGARGKSFLAVTKVWANGTQAEKDAWFVFTLASFLLGNDGHQYMTFTYAPGDATVDRPWYHLALGAPSGPYAKLNGVYQRSFAAGRVLVNPTQSSFTIKLGATFHTLGGLPVTSVKLAPDSAVILTL